MNSMNKNSGYAVGIIGYGFVGQATAKGFASSKENKVLWYDKFKAGGSTFDEVVKNSEFIFVSVPTPMFSDYSGMDMSIVEEVVENIAEKVSGTTKIIIIKSTSLPGTTAKMAKKYPKVNFVMNPEFLTQEKANEDFLNPTRTVLGVSEQVTGDRLKQLYETILPKDQSYYIMDTTSAELTKYMSNLMLASKILLANEFFLLSQKVGADYDNVRKAVEADKRIGTFLRVPGWDGDFGFGKACFPKDMIGILGFAKKNSVDMSALQAIWDKNIKIRKNRDWEHMPQAFTSKKK